MTVIAMIGSNGGHRDTKLRPLMRFRTKCIFSTIAWGSAALGLKKPDLPIIDSFTEANA